MKPVDIILLSAVVLFGLSGCATTPTVSPIVTKTEVYMPPDKLFTCNGVKLPLKFQNDKDVSILIVEQHSAIKKCKNNMNAIKKSLDDASSTLNN